MHPILHLAEASEGVTEPSGLNAVYVEASNGEMHWLSIFDDFDWAKAYDQDLGFSGSSPLILDQYRLMFLSSDNGLRLYDKRAGSVVALGSDTYREFLPGYGGIYAVTTSNQLVLIDWDSGDSTVLMEPFPEIRSIDAPPLPLLVFCPLYCYYSVLPKGGILAPGMIVSLHGAGFQQEGWRVRSSGGTKAFDLPLTPLSDELAQFQIPNSLPQHTYGMESFELYHPDHPVTFHPGILFGVFTNVVVCMQTQHEDNGGPVTTADPAAIGEIVHVTVTGLKGAEDVPDGEPNPADHPIDVINPPLMADPGATEMISSRLIPGAIGLQQIDLRIIRPSTTPLLFANVNSQGCEVPAIAAK